MKRNREKPRLRNLLHDHPLMRKGGVHEKSNKAKRKQERQKFKKEWCCLMLFAKVILNNTFPLSRNRIGGFMNNIELNKFRRLVGQMDVPFDRTIPTQANFRWLIANAWIKNRNHPKLYDLVKLIRPYA